MRNLTIALGLVIFGLAGFYGGAKYESGRVTPVSAGAVSGTGLTGTGAGGGRATGGTGATAGTGNGGSGAGGAFVGGFGRGTSGRITAVSGDTLTIQDAQGNDIKVQLQAGTTIIKSASGTKDDLASGVTVTVGGQRASDGTVTATTITILPAGLTIGGAPRG